MTRSTYADWTKLGFDSWLLAWNASTVIGLRMMTFAAGGAAASREAQLMVSEKIQAAAELQTAMMTGKLGTTPLANSQAIVRRYGAKVRANRKRLS